MPRSRRTLVCSCEDVTLDDVEACIEKGYADVESVKRYTGFGTGICQGRYCLAAVTRVLVARGLDPAGAEAITPRPPVFPVPLGRLAGAKDDET